MNEEQFWILTAKNLCQESSLQEDEELEYYINSSLDYKNNYTIVKELWQSTPQIRIIAPSSQDAFLLHLSRLEEANKEKAVEVDYIKERKTRVFLNKFNLALVCTTLLALFVFLFWKNETIETYNNNKPEQLSEIKVAKGTRTKIDLPDGTQIWINSDSKINYDKKFNVEDRKIYLEGEAYFDVVKNPDKPFYVYAGNTTIKVTGTAFNVKAYANEKTTETSLVRGSVELMLNYRPNEKFYLKPNEKFISTNDPSPTEKTTKNDLTSIKESSQINAAIKIQPISTSKNIITENITETAWVYNKLKFHENENFGEVALQMERWYNVKIDFASPELKLYHLYGSFTTETITQALDALKLIAPFNYKKDGNNFLIYKQ